MYYRLACIPTGSYSVVIDHATSPSLDAFVPNATQQPTTPKKQEENSQQTKSKTNDEQPKCYRTKKEAMTPYYKTKKTNNTQ
jgi:hypothetical protein